MIGKEKIKFVRSLHQKKFRQKYNKFIAEGPKIIRECIESSNEIIDTIYGLPSFIKTLKGRDDILNKKLIDVDSIALGKISALDTPNQGLAILEMPAEQTSLSAKDALYLDGIQIPNNVGAILRIADWYGIEEVYYSENTADVFGPKVIQASMGSFARLKFHTCEPSDLRKVFPNHQILVADGAGKDLKTVAFANPCLLILGSEGKGPSANSITLSDAMVKISRTNGTQLPESLNVAVAAGILCHHWKSGA